MRQRKIKNLDEKIDELSRYIVAKPEENFGRWNKTFGNDGPIYMEIGSGKGKFITTLAENHREMNFIGVEGQRTVAFRILEKADEKEISNLKLIDEYVDPPELEKFFCPRELSGIYLNFSDPWPKERHEKRRLTYAKRLLTYCKIVKSGGFIRFKTDNEGLFEYSLEQIKAAGLEIVKLERDLHNSELEERLVTTEYEDKFHGLGKNINYVEIIVK